MHAVLSATTKVPELALDESEARELAKAAAEVQSHYDAAIVDPKTMAWVQLGMVVASLYGPRLIAFNIRSKNEKKAKKQNNVVEGNFPNHAPTG